MGLIYPFIASPDYNKDLFSEEQAELAELPQFPGSPSDDEETLEFDRDCTWDSWQDDMAWFDPVELGEVSKLRILVLDDRIGQQLQTLDLFRFINKQWKKARILSNPWYKRRQNWDLVFDLVHDMSDKMIEEHWGHGLLCLAVGAGCMPKVQRLMIRAHYIGVLKDELFREAPHDKLIHELIRKAAFGNHVDVVEHLLKENGDEAHCQCNALRPAILHRDRDRYSMLICIGNIKPISVITGGREDHIDLQARGTGSEADMLGSLVDLFEFEPGDLSVQRTGSVEEALQHRAEKHFKVF
ncbi:hypothetical protein N7512_002409 [Penicillium capsulatum]|nr:hypothetical protein N7512_002409 [Penicillium capsulatum]